MGRSIYNFTIGIHYFIVPLVILSALSYLFFVYLGELRAMVLMVCPALILMFAGLAFLIAYKIFKSEQLNFCSGILTLTSPLFLGAFVSGWMLYLFIVEGKALAGVFLATIIIIPILLLYRSVRRYKKSLLKTGNTLAREKKKTYSPGNWYPATEDAGKNWYLILILIIIVNIGLIPIIGDIGIGMQFDSIFLLFIIIAVNIVFPFALIMPVNAVKFDRQAIYIRYSLFNRVRVYPWESISIMEVLEESNEDEAGLRMRQAGRYWAGFISEPGLVNRIHDIWSGRHNK